MSNNKIIFILALLGMNIRLNLIGSISVTEICMVFMIPHLWRWLKTEGSQIPHLMSIVKAFGVLVLFQIVSGFMVGNSVEAILKNIAVTIFAVLLMLFYLEKLVEDRSLLLWIPVCNILGLLLFGSQFGYENESDITYFKFYVAPIVISLACTLMLMRLRWIQNQLYAFILFSGVSLFVIVGGARSLGFSMFMTALGAYMIDRYETLNFKKMLLGIIVGVIILQCFLTFIYVPGIRDGRFSTNHYEQMARIGWKSNILAILLTARSDFYVSTIAFLDKPIWGHGYGALDSDRRYHILQASLFDEKFKGRSDAYLLPVHSCVVGMGTTNGIFAFITFLWIFVTVYKLAFMGLLNRSPYNIYFLWVIISSFQHLMFGPPTILKNNGAIAFATMLALYYVSVKMNRKQMRRVNVKKIQKIKTYS